jgi:hypothetical protein
MPNSYEPANPNKIVQECEYLTVNNQIQLLSLIYKYEHLFDGSLGTLYNKP